MSGGKMKILKIKVVYELDNGRLYESSIKPYEWLITERVVDAGHDITKKLEEITRTIQGLMKEDNE